MKVSANDFTWNRGMVSNVGAWSLMNSEGWMIAHMWRGNNNLWSACEDDGTTIIQNVTRAEALRVTDETMCNGSSR